MRRFSLFGMAVFALIATIAVTTGGCGKNNNDTPVTLGGNISNGGCPAGTISHPQYGCLDTTGCPAGTGRYFGSCITVPNYGTGGSCQPGYVYTSNYGCLPQSGCGYGYGWLNGRCVPADGGVNTCQGSCGAGYVQTRNGCMPQGGCPTCYGTDGRYCYPGGY